MSNRCKYNMRYYICFINFIETGPRTRYNNISKFIKTYITLLLAVQNKDKYNFIVP